MTTAPPVTLSAWLLTQIAADENEANRAGARQRHWHLDETHCCVRVDDHGYHDDIETHVNSAAAEHIARHDPARVLAECEAKRQIVQRCLDVIASFGDWDAAEVKAAGGRVLWSDVNRRERSHAHATLDLLALPYADRDGYQEEWRP